MPADPWAAMQRPGGLGGSASTIRQRPVVAAQDEASACELAESDEELQEEEVNNSGPPLPTSPFCHLAHLVLLQMLQGHGMQ